MDEKELNQCLDAYYERVAIRNSCYYQGKPFKQKDFIFFNKRRSVTELSLFIADAMILKSLEYEGNVLPCSSVDFRENSIQFHLLNNSQLLNYIVFRTCLKKEKIPPRRSVGFLTLYLMEILNGIYSNSYEFKFDAISKVYSFFPKSNLYEDLFKEAFEILYLQNIDCINLKDYLNKTPLSVFNDSNFFDNFKERKQKICFDLMIESVESIGKFKINETDRYIFEECFDFLYTILNKKDYMINSNYKSIDSLIYSRREEKYNFPLRHLMAQYPPTLDLKIQNLDGNESIFKNGIHTKILNNHEIRPSNTICYSTVMILNLIAFNCGFIVEDTKPIESRTYYKIPSDNIRFIELNKEDVSFAIKKWVNKHWYVRVGYRLPLWKLKSFKNGGYSSSDLKEYENWKKEKSQIYYSNKARFIRDKQQKDYEDIINRAKKAHNGGNYLSTEDRKNKFNQLIQSNIEANIIYNSSMKTTTKEIVSSNDEAKIKFKNSLSQLENIVLIYLINDKFEAADDYAWKNDDLISSVIDRINMKSKRYLFCEIIEDEKLIDKYKNRFIE